MVLLAAIALGHAATSKAREALGASGMTDPSTLAQLPLVLGRLETAVSCAKPSQAMQCKYLSRPTMSQWDRHKT